MGEQLVSRMVTALDKVNWPQEPHATEQGWEAYKIGLEKVDSYRDDPKVLAGALRTFQSGQSRPYAFAGVAYTLLAAARETDGSYAESGLDAAMEWLEMAQELAPDNVYINMIEALIYIYNGRFDDARLILDYLHNIEPRDYYLYLVEVEYWLAQRDQDRTVEWIEKTIAEAQTVPQKLQLRAKLADSYFESNAWEKALDLYKEMVRFDTENHLLWHKMAIIHWHLEDYKESYEANKKSLAIRDFSAGRKLEAALKEKLGSGMLKRWFGG